jgi:ABC-type lipoprotein export system ATPase subunit
MNTQQYPGSHWWKFDFHNHTPASSDYDLSEIKTLQARDWLLAYMGKGIDCVAVTDHNTSGWIDRLQSALSEMEKDDPPVIGYRPLTLFPGIEITTSDSLHILAIFSPKTSKSTLDGLLHGKLKISNEGALTAELMFTEGASTVVDHIHEMGGLAIAAHVERPNGLLQGASAGGPFKPSKPGRVIDDILPKLDGMEFQSLECEPYRHFASRINHLALVAGSDAHTRASAGDRFTWVKMSEPSFDGLRLALLDPESAIRRADQAMNDPQRFPEQWIESITLENMHLRRPNLSPLNLLFNPAYNAVIGGRGSGKSTILECLRLGLAREGELRKLGETSEIWNTFDGFRKVYINKDKPGMMLPGTKITVVVIKGRGVSSQRFQFVWSQQGERFVTQVARWENGVWQGTGLNEKAASDFFPVKIFSQKQILALANNPQALLEHIDNSMLDRKKAWIQQFDACKSTLLAARLRVRTLKKELEKKPALELEYKEANRKALVFKNANFGHLLKAYQRATQQQRAMADFYQLLANDIAGLQAGIEQAANLTSSELTQFLVETQAEEVERENAMVLKSQLVGQYEKIVAAAAAMQSQLTAAQQKQASSIWQQENQKHLQAYLDETARLKSEGINSANEAGIAVAAEEKLRKQLEQVNILISDLEQAERAVEDAAQALSACREKLTEERRALIGQLPEQNNMLEISLRGMASTKNEVDRLRGILKLGNGDNFAANFWTEDESDGVQKPSGILADIVTVADDALISGRLAELKQALEDMHEKRPGSKILNTKFGATLIRRVEALPTEAFDELACWFPEDEVVLKYRPKKNDALKNINQASAGQKTAAMLSFLLVYGEEPLLLDQPEDDLDNALVSELVVEQLRKNKVRRQLVVVTHNANIVVNADAELVMTMDYKNGQINLASAGGLQETNVRQDICRVMEGGEQAFRQRYKRILEDLEKRQ